jgi:hypothetical protein
MTFDCHSGGSDFDHILERYFSLKIAICVSAKNTKVKLQECDKAYQSPPPTLSVPPYNTYISIFHL